MHLARLPILPILPLLPLLTALACTPKDSDDTTAATDSATAESTVGATSEPTDGATTADPDHADFDALNACTPTDCPTFSHTFAEGSPLGEVDGACVFTALRDGVAGRHIYATEHTYSNGNETATTVLVVHADRKVSFSTHRSALDMEGASSEHYSPAMTCTLADAAYFADCLLAGAAAYDCVWLDSSPWWTDCTMAPPSCA